MIPSEFVSTSDDVSLLSLPLITLSKTFKSLGSRVDRFLGVSRAFTSCCKLNFDDNSNVNSITVNPVLRYDDADVDKVKIFGDNRDKSGVYRCFFFLWF